MEKDRFRSACEKVIGQEYVRSSVGLLSEKTMHAVIKEYIEPDRAFHEQKIGPFFADICRDGHIYEIQTRSFDRLRSKLDLFLKEHVVTVVYPIPASKTLFWVNGETGATSAPRKVGKKGRFADAGRELYKIFPYLTHPNLEVLLLLIDMQEYRLQDGYGQNGKRGSHRIDRIPLALQDSLCLTNAASFSALLPSDIVEPFTAADFRKAVKGGPRTAPALLQVLLRLGLVKKIGQKGKAYLYEKTEKE